MLTARKLENRPIQAMRVALTAYIAVNATRTTERGRDHPPSLLSFSTVDAGDCGVTDRYASLRSQINFSPRSVNRSSTSSTCSQKGVIASA